jgi:RNA polymerase sigma-70 factor (sigma-E family)
VVNVIVGGQPAHAAPDDTAPDSTITVPAAGLEPGAPGIDGDARAGTELRVMWGAHQIVTEIYRTHYKALVGLALLLVRDAPTAEEVVQDAFEAMHTASRRLRDNEKALRYLRQTVVNKSRSVLRHRVVMDKNAPRPAPDEPSAENGALTAIERNEVIAALRALPCRQREALVLRYYAELSEAEIAATMGISRGAVKSHTARGMSALRSLLRQETP